MRTYIIVIQPESGQIFVAYSDDNMEPGTYSFDSQLPPFEDENGARKVVSALNQAQSTIL